MTPGITGVAITALALVLIVEGAVYALFPEAMKRIIVVVAAQPSSSLRNVGFLTAIAGLGLLWLMRRLGA